MAVPAATVNQYYTGIFRQAPSAAVSTAYQQMPTANDALNSMLSAANLTVDPVVRLYQTAFNRVPDSAGLTAWVPFMTSSTNPAQSLQQIANGFAQSTEFLNLYPASLSNAQYVGALYWNILQRQGEDAGMAAWINALNNGSLTRAQVLVGFSNSPEFTIRIEPNVNNFLTNCANNTETYTGSLFDQGSGTVTSYALTTNVDTIITTTTGQNVVNGVVNNNTGSSASTLNPGDSIDGTKGTTTVSIVDTATAAQTLSNFTLTGVNTFKVQNNSTAGDQIFDLTNATGLANIAVVNTNAAGNTNFTGVKAIVGASVSSTVGNVDIAYASAAVSGSADAMSIALSGVATTANSTINANGIETFNVTSSGTASGASTGNLRVTLDGDAVKVVNISGSAGARITADYAASADGSGSTKVATLNASTSTGALDIALTTGGANIGNYVSVTGGSGNDTVRLNVLSTNATIAGGDGTDTLAINSLAGGSNDFKNVTGFEALRFLGATAGNLNLTNAGDIASVIFDGATTASLQGVKSGISAQLNAAANNLVVDVTGAAGSTSDVVNVTVGSASATAVLAGGTVTATNIETLNLSSLTKSGTVAGQHSVTLTDAAATTLNISGNQAVAVTMGAGSLTSVNASTATGSVDISGIANGAFSSTAATVTGGSGNDLLKDGDGNDLVTAGSGNDTVVSGAGNDTIDAGDGNDSIEAGTGNDSITMGGGNDVILFTAVNTLTSGDTVSGGDGADKILLGTALAGVTLADSAFKNVSGIETITAADAAAADSINLTLGANANAAAFTTISAHTTAGVVDGAGDVVVTATSAYKNAVTIIAGSGTDTINFGGTAGTFTYGTKDNWLTAADAITGGITTTDALRIEANGGTANLTSVSGVESVTILANATAPATTASSLTIGSDNTVVLGEALTVDASALTGSTSTFTFDGSAEVTTGTLAGRFSVVGGNANDTLTGGSGNDTFVAGTGNDSVSGGAGNDAIDGGSGNNILLGGAGNDVITAGAGNDQITGGTGADSITAGAGNDLLIYVEATDSLAVNSASGQTSMDVIDGFNAGSGTAATVVDKIGSATAVTSIGNVTIGTASATTLATALQANATLAAATAGQAYVVNISGGTAAGTYLTIVGGAGGYTATRDTVVRLTNATNLENLITNNFALGTSTTWAPGVAFAVNTSTGAFTSTNTTYATAAAAILAGVTNIQGTNGVVDQVDATANATAVSFNFATGALSGAANAAANNLSYTLFDLFAGSNNGDTVVDGVGNEIIGLGTGSNTLTLSGGGTDAVDVTTAAGKTNTVSVSASSGTATYVQKSAQATANDLITVSGAQTLVYNGSTVGTQGDSTLTFSRALTANDKYLALAASDTKLVLNAAQGAAAFTLAAANFTAVDTIELGKSGGVYNLVTTAANAVGTITAATNVVLGDVTIDASATTNALVVTLSNGATYTGNSAVTLKGNDGAGAVVASTFTGGSGIDAVTVNSYIGGTDKTLNISTQAGNDTIGVTTATTAVGNDDMQIDGGLGTDTLTLTQGVATTANAGDIKEMETVKVSGNFAFSWTTADADYATAGTNVALSLAPAVLSNITLDASSSNDANWTLDFTALAAKAYSIKTDAGNDSVTVTLSDDNGLDVAADTVNLGAGTDTLTIALNGKALDGTFGAGFAGLETIKTTGTGAIGGGGALKVATAGQGVTLFDISSVVTGSKIDVSTMTAGTVKLGGAAGATNLLVNGISAGSGDITVEFGAGNATVDDLKSTTNVVNLKFAATNAATQAVTFAATAADFGTGDKFNFAGNVVTIVGATANIAGQLIVSNAAGDTTMLYDADGNGVFGVGDTQITITGQALTAAAFGIVGGAAVLL